MDSYILFSLSIFLISCGFFSFSFWIKNKTQLRAEIFSPFLLVLGSLTITIGFIQIFTWGDAKILFLTKVFPKAPSIINNYKSLPFIRIKDSILFLPPPNREFQTFGHESETNPIGFRERDFTRKIPPKTFRILVFGDSLTFGVGVADEQRYTNILEKMLNISLENENNKIYDHVEVLNFGVPGFSLDQEHDLIASILKIIEGHLVVIGFLSNDFDITTRYGLKNITVNKGDAVVEVPYFRSDRRTFHTIPEYPPKLYSRTPKFYEEFFIYKLLRNRTGWLAKDALPNASNWAYILNEFIQIKLLTDKYDMPPPVIALLHYGGMNPSDNDFENPKGLVADNMAILNFVAKELSSRGFILADTLPLFKKFSGMVFAVSEWEMHPNYLAHYIYAKSILNVLQKNLLR